MVGFNIVLLTLTAKLLRTIDEQIMNMDKLIKYLGYEGLKEILN